MAITIHDIFQIRKKNELKKLEFLVIFCLVIFLFNQSKNNAVLEPRTGHFRGLVGSGIGGGGSGGALTPLLGVKVSEFWATLYYLGNITSKFWAISYFSGKLASKFRAI